jgi:assimilatory nitrate reductase catalytic subunit
MLPALSSPRIATPASVRETHCPYCALQCGVTLDQTANGGISLGARNFPTNRGKLCPKGWTAAELLSHPDRLQTPLLRDEKRDRLRPVSWDEAFDRIARSVNSLASHCVRPKSITTGASACLPPPQHR